LNGGKGHLQFGGMDDPLNYRNPSDYFDLQTNRVNFLTESTIGYHLFGCVNIYLKISVWIG